MDSFYAIVLKGREFILSQMMFWCFHSFIYLTESIFVQWYVIDSQLSLYVKSQ